MIKYTLSLILLLLAGCATRGDFLTIEKDAWMNLNTTGGGSYGNGLYYCKANNSDKSANPVCYQMKRYDKESNQEIVIESESLISKNPSREDAKQSIKEEEVKQNTATKECKSIIGLPITCPKGGK